MDFWRSFCETAKLGRRSSLFKFFVFFLVFQVFYEQHGSTNVASRLAQLASMSQRSSFDITPYKNDWTVDWAETPDGRVYSNKAPGPAFLAFPIYWVFDRLTVDRSRSEIDNRGLRNNLGHHFFRIATLLFQILPYFLIGLYFLGELIKTGSSLGAQRAWILAYLFGSTASVFLNTYFGHGVGTVAVLLLYISMRSRHWLWAGWFFGWALLSDYALAMVLPVLLVFLLSQRAPLKNWIHFVLGGVLPGGLWVWYHTVCFGSPLLLPNKFQNPAFVDMAESSTSLWGVIDIFPNLGTTLKLFVGTERGLLFSQPWTLLVFGSLLSWQFRPYLQSNRPYLKFALASFGAVFLMNASFGGWHGGASAGPRYLAVVLPLLTLFIPSIWDRAKTPLRAIYAVAILYSTLLFGLILSAGVNTPVSGTLLGDLLQKILRPDSVTAPARFTIFVFAFIGVLVWDLRATKKANNP